MSNEECEQCKPGKKVELVEDIASVPAGTRGTCQGATGRRCRVKFENAVDTLVPCNLLRLLD